MSTRGWGWGELQADEMCLVSAELLPRPFHDLVCEGGICVLGYSPPYSFQASILKSLTSPRNCLGTRERGNCLMSLIDAKSKPRGQECAQGMDSTSVLWVVSGRPSRWPEGQGSWELPGRSDHGPGAGLCVCSGQREVGPPALGSLTGSWRGPLAPPG